MTYCNQSTITDNAFKYLADSKTLTHLNMSWCQQSTITDNAFKYLANSKSLLVLNMYACYQTTITSRASMYMIKSKGKAGITIHGNPHIATNWDKFLFFIISMYK